MRVTEARVKCAGGDGRVIAYASIVLDGELVIHNLKAIRGKDGPFVAMPDQEVLYKCQKCGRRNPHQAVFCMHCGVRLTPLADGLPRFESLVHPITQGLRDEVTRSILSSVESG